MSVNRASEVWKEIKPFALRDLKMLQDAKSADSAINSGYYIILYDVSALKLKYYSASSTGLHAALAAAGAGDIVWLPACTITNEASYFSAGEEISTGAITVTSEAGNEISGLTPGQWYAVEAHNGPWQCGELVSEGVGWTFDSDFEGWSYNCNDQTIPWQEAGKIGMNYNNSWAASDMEYALIKTFGFNVIAGAGAIISFDWIYASNSGGQSNAYIVYQGSDNLWHDNSVHGSLVRENTDGVLTTYHVHMDITPGTVVKAIAIWFSGAGIFVPENWYVDNVVMVGCLGYSYADDYYFSLSDGAGYSGAIGLRTYPGAEVNFDGSVPGFNLILPDFAAYAEAVDAYYGRVYFQATTASIFVRACDMPDGFADNLGTLSWRLRNATANIGSVIPAGVEVAGMGENCIIDGDIENNGMLTNVQVTGAISGAGSYHAFDSDSAWETNKQIISDLATGTSPFEIASTTLNTNLNADMVDGEHIQKRKLDGTTAPTAADDSGDGYAVGSVWVDVTNDKSYVCVDGTVDAAVWIEDGGGGGGGDVIQDGEITAGHLAVFASDHHVEDGGPPEGGGSVLLSYPIGAIYISVVSINPATLFGGTWAAFGTGRTLVGIDTNDTDFDTVEETYGEKTHSLIISETPAHVHNPLTTLLHSDGALVTEEYINANLAYGQARRRYQNPEESRGGDGAHNNIQPSIVVYMWKRTA